jgi:uncharacterized protein YegL
MGGEPIRAVHDGMQMLVNALMDYPDALETACLSIIAFSTHAQQMLPLTELSQIVLPKFTAKGWTALGEALKVVAECANKEVAKNTPDTKGDWKPMVFIMSDGHATDNLTSGIEVFKQYKWGVVVACAVGKVQTKGLAELQAITSNVIQLDSKDSATIKEYFKWISQSIISNSISVGVGKDNITNVEQLPPLPSKISLAYNME